MSITTKVASSSPIHGEVYAIQHYVIKFVSDLRQVGGFFRVLRFPPPIKLTVYNWNIVKSGVKYHKPKLGRLKSQAPSFVIYFLVDYTCCYCIYKCIQCHQSNWKGERYTSFYIVFRNAPEHLSKLNIKLHAKTSIKNINLKQNIYTEKATSLQTRP